MGGRRAALSSKHLTRTAIYRLAQPCERLRSFCISLPTSSAFATARVPALGQRSTRAGDRAERVCRPSPKI